LASAFWSHSFGLSFGLEHLASIWPQYAADKPSAKKRRTSLFADYRTSHNAAAVSHDAASEQLHHYISVINNEFFNPTATSSHLDKLSLDYPLLQPVFSRVFYVSASSAPIKSFFCQIQLIVSACRANADCCS